MLQIALICRGPGCHLGVLNLIFFIIHFVLHINYLIAAILAFLLSLLLVAVGFSVHCRNPICLLLSFVRMLFLLLRKSLLMISI